MRQFAAVLRQIACKQFMPDSLRSGYFPFPPGPAAHAPGAGAAPEPREVSSGIKAEGSEVPQHGQAPLEIIESSDDAASESTSDPGDDSSGEAEEPEPKKARFDESSDDVLLLRHRVSDKVHMLKGQSDRSILDQVLCCGRPLTDAYTRIDVPRTGQDRCAVCFRHWPMPQRDMS